MKSFKKIVLGTLLAALVSTLALADSGLILNNSAGGGGGSIGGSIALHQIAFGTAANTIGGSNNFYYTGTSVGLVGDLGITGGMRLSGSVSGGVVFNVPSVVTIYQILYPDAQGGAGTTLLNDGSGNLTWGLPSASLPQYEIGFGSNSNTLTGNNNFVYDGTSVSLNPNNLTSVGFVIGSGSGGIIGAYQFVNFTSASSSSGNDSVILGNKGNQIVPSGFSSVWQYQPPNDDYALNVFGGSSYNPSGSGVAPLAALVWIDTLGVAGSQTGSVLETSNLYIDAASTLGTTNNYSLRIVGDTLEHAHLLFNPNSANFSSGVFGIGSTLLGNEIHSSDVTNGIYITGDSGGSNVQLLNIKLQSFGSLRQTIALPADANGLFFNTPITNSAAHDYQFLMAGLSLFKIQGTGNGSGSLASASMTINASDVPSTFNMVGAGSANLFTFDGVNNKIVLGSSVPSSGNIFVNVAGINPTTPINAFEYIYFNVFPTITTPASGTNSNLYGVQLAALNYTSGGATITNAYTLYIAGSPTKTGGAGPIASNAWSLFIDGVAGDNSLWVQANATFGGKISHTYTTSANSDILEQNSFNINASGGSTAYTGISTAINIATVAGSASTFYGNTTSLNINSSASLTGTIAGYNSFISSALSSGAINIVKSFNSSITGGSSGITNAYDFYATNATDTGTHYGFFTENLIGGTNNYGLYITGASTRAIKVVSGTSEFDDRAFVTYTTSNNGDTAFSSTLNSTTTTGAFTYNGSNAVVNVVGTTDTSSTFNGLSIFANGTALNASLTSGGNITGINSLSLGNAGAGKTLAELAGVNSIIETTGTGNITSVINYSSAVFNTATGTTASAIGYDVINATNGGGGTITNQYGIVIGNLTSGASNYGLYIAGASTNAIWVNSGKSRFDGSIYPQHIVGNKLYSGYAIPGVTAGTGAASGTPSITGSDVAGVVSVTTGVAPSAGGTVVTVTFNVPYASNTIIELTPANAATALLSGVTMVYATGGTTTFVITAGSTALTGLTAYSWNYHVLD